MHAERPLHVSQTVTASDDHASAFNTRGTVDVTPLAAGAQPFQAKIAEMNASELRNRLSQATLLNVQTMIPAAPGRGSQPFRPVRVGSSPGSRSAAP